MHIERIDFDEVFDIQKGTGDFSFRSRGLPCYAVNLHRRLIPQDGSAYLVAFATPGDWSTVLGWLDLQTGTCRLKESTWLALLDEIGALAWLAPFLLGGMLLFAGPAAALAALLGLLGYAGLRLYGIARRGRRVQRALTAAHLDAQAVPAGAAGGRALR